MISIRFLGVFVVFGLAGILEAQVVDARENLILPVNPPRIAGGRVETSANLDQQISLHWSVTETIREIEKAQASGLGSGHPKVKSLWAKLDVIQEQLNAKPSRQDSALPKSLANRIAQFEAWQREKEAELSREVASLKAEVAQLREELKKAQK